MFLGAKTAAALAFAFTGLGAMAAAPAMAAYPPGPTCTLTLSASVVAPGASVGLSVQAGCFGDGSSGTIDIESTPVLLANFTADSSGGLSGSVTIPTITVSGNHTILANGTSPSGSPLTLSAPLVVTGASTVGTQTGGTSTGASSGTGGLAFTGATIFPLVGAGVALILLGGVAIRASRRRSSTSSI